MTILNHTVESVSHKIKQDVKFLPLLTIPVPPLDLDFPCQHALEVICFVIYRLQVYVYKKRKRH